MSKSFAPLLLTATTALWFGTATADEHGHAHPSFAPDVDAFHSVLAPIWHARPGKARLRDACAQADEMGKRAGAIRSADASALIAAVTRLQVTCKSQPAGIDSAFFDVHEAFHGLIDAHPGRGR